MNSKNINIFFEKLKKKIKNPKSDLKYKNKFTLLVSVILSAQCTDVNVNNVTKNIYKKYFKPEHFLNLGEKNLFGLNQFGFREGNTFLFLFGFMPFFIATVPFSFMTLVGIT